MRKRTPNFASHMRKAFSSMVLNTGCSSPGEREMTLSTSEVAVCCSSASKRCPRASSRSRVRASSCFFNSISELGPLLTCALAFVSAERSLRPRVGLFAPLRDKVTSSAQSTGRTRSASFNHLVGAREQRWRLDREVGRFRPTQNLVNIVASATEEVCDVRSIGHQTPAFKSLPNSVNRRQSCDERKGVDAVHISRHEGVVTDI